MDPNTTLPVPDGRRLISSFVRVPSILLPLNFKAGHTPAPVPAGAKTISSLLLTALISLPVKVNVSVLIPGALYISVNIVFTLIIASRNVSPVPSLAFVPTFKLILGILRVHNLSHDRYSVRVSVIYCSP